MSINKIIEIIQTQERMARRNRSIIDDEIEMNWPIDTTESDYDRKKDSSGHTQWAVSDNGAFLPISKTAEKLPAGLYEIKNDSQRGIHIQQIKSISEELFILPSPEITEIIADIKKFWEGREIFKKYNYIHKRGILLHGSPGCGKSGIIHLCIKHVVEEMNGIVINIKDHYQVELFDEFIQTIRKIEPTRPLIILMEDLDALVGEDKYVTSKLLNILDGIKQIEGVVYLASTNYPEKLEERVSNRPSRFDRRYRIELPSSEIRESYLKFKLPEADQKKIDLKKWVKDSEGFSLAHLKELVISTLVLGNSYQDSLAHLKEMKNKPKNSGSKSGGIGFGNRD
jgi:AAA+ superfamily predicted ATPase